MNSTNSTIVTQPDLLLVYILPIVSQMIIALFIFVFEFLKKRNNNKFLDLLTQHNNECIEKLSNEVKSLHSHPPFEIVNDETNQPYPSPHESLDVTPKSIRVDENTKKIRLGDYVISFESTPRR